MTQFRQVGHVCKFDDDLKDSVKIVCEEGVDGQKGAFSGLDENGDRKNITYVVLVGVQ